MKWRAGCEDQKQPQQTLRHSKINTHSGVGTAETETETRTSMHEEKETDRV